MLLFWSDKKSSRVLSEVINALINLKWITICRLLNKKYDHYGSKQTGERKDNYVRVNVKDVLLLNNLIIRQTT